MGKRTAGTSYDFVNKDLIGHPDFIGETPDGIPVMSVKREAVLDFCKVNFSLSSSIWNSDYWEIDSGFLFRILDRWVFVNPAVLPVETRELSNSQAWRWFEVNEKDPPNILKEWHRNLLDVSQHAGAVMQTEPPWGPQLRVLIDRHFPNDVDARFVGLGISQGETTNELKEFLISIADQITQNMLLDNDESGRKKYLRTRLSSAINQLKPKLRKEGFDLSLVGGRYELVPFKPTKNKPKR